MKSTLHSLQARVVLTTSITALLILSFLTGGRANAAVTTFWTGAGPDGRWRTSANWTNNIAPTNGDALVFRGTKRLDTTNNFDAGTPFSGITFAGPGGFTLWPAATGGNLVTNTGNFTNKQVVTEQVIALPIALSGVSTVDVVTNGVLTFVGSISGPGGLTLANGGTVALRAANTFTNIVTVNGGTLVISGDSGLGNAPTNFVATGLVLNRSTLAVTNSMTINSNRGIRLGPTSGSGFGTFEVDPITPQSPGRVITYDGVLANNGAGIGGLDKIGFGGLSLGGSNTYTGPTLLECGTITLNFISTNAAQQNIINTNSALILGGANSGAGVTNFAALVISPRAGAANFQGFKSTHLNVGAAVIQAVSNTASTVNVRLGPLDHDTGGIVTFVTPSLAGISGNFTTSTTNTHGILGGWAYVGNGRVQNGILMGTNLAAVDGSGNVVVFTNYLVYNSGYLHGLVTSNDNLLINSTSAGDITNDVNGAGTTTDVNTITARRWEAGSTVGWAILIGTNNTLRLGKYGAILRSDTGGNGTWVIGQAVNGLNTAGSQNVGTLTAGGGDNAPGEIVINVNSTSESTGSLNIDAKIADNGTGKVSVVKYGPSSMKMRGHNTFSGGCYVLTGRFQTAGGESGTANGDAYGTGPVYELPGCYLFLSGLANGDISNTIQNACFISGNGTQGEPLGCVRGPGGISGPTTLIGDVTLGNSTQNGGFSGKISGPFDVIIGPFGTVNGSTTLSNPSNDWSGNTIIQARNNTGVNILLNGTNDVIPDGFGKGNVTLLAYNSGQVTWNLNGFSETINGLSTSGNARQANITNTSAASASTLTVGGNDQSTRFSARIEDSGSGGTTILNLTKIGAGIFTLNATNRYAGDTTVNGGTLALINTAAIPLSRNIVVSNAATLDVSGLNAASGGFAARPDGAVVLNNGTLIGNTASPAGVNTLSMTNGALTESINPNVTNVFVNRLTLGGTTNLINIQSVTGVTNYPSTFPLVNLLISGVLGANNLGLGTVPTVLTVGYVTNNTGSPATANQVQVVLLNGPKTQVWKGTNALNPTVWDDSTTGPGTTNWLGFGTTPNAFLDQDSVVFDDRGVTNLINLTTNVIPAFVTVSNTVRDYTFTNIGSISGLAGLLKQGTKDLVIANGDPVLGQNGFRGGVTVSGGNVTFVSDNTISGGITVSTGSVVRAGVGGASGTLPSGDSVNNGAIVFNRSDSALVIPNSFSGSGNFTNLGTGTVTLNGGSTFTGVVDIVNGTLIANANTALGSTNGATLVETGATLDVGGSALGNEPIIVGANNAGVGGLGAIINNDVDQINATRDVTLLGNATFGGNARWDIRLGGGVGRLVTAGNPYALTKVGTNQISFVGINVDSGLGDVIVQQGVFSAETSINDLGDATYSVIVSNGATFQVFNIANTISKPIVLNGNGTNITLNCPSGANNNLAGAMTLSGTCIFGGAAGTVLNLRGAISDGATAGSVLLNDAGLVVMHNQAINYSGTTVLTNGGDLRINGSKNGAGAITVYSNSVLGGSGGFIGGDVTVNPGGGISPGDPNSTALASFTVAGNVSMNNSANVFELGTSPNNDTPGAGSDGIDCFSGLTLLGTNVINIQIPLFIDVSNSYTLMRSATLTGGTNNVQLVAPVGYGFHLLPVGPSGGFYRIKLFVDKAIGNDTWVGGQSGGNGANAWDTNVTANWSRTGHPTTVFTDGDFANFDNSGGAHTNVTLFGPLSPSETRFLNDANLGNQSGLAYKLVGSGYITGTNGMTLSCGSGVSVGQVIFANGDSTHSNDFSGRINFNAGQLSIGDGGTVGSFGWGGDLTMSVTNLPTLIYNHSDNLEQSNNISGAGTIIKKGAGVLTLDGTGGSWTGLVVVAAGTLKLNNVTPVMDSSNVITVVSNGATLDFGIDGDNAGGNNHLSMSSLITVSGSGVGGLGAIVNNSTNSQHSALVTGLVLAGDTTFGGNGGFTNRADLGVGDNGGRWDIRSSGTNGVLSTSGNPYKLTKIGTNQVSFVAVSVDPALGDIDVQQGILGFETTTTGMGNPASNLIVHAGATIEFFSSTNEFNKNMQVTGDGLNASFWNASGNTVIVAPVHMTNTCVINVASASLTFTNNTIDGTGSLLKEGANILNLAGNNSWTGNTVITNGRLALIGTSTLNNSPVINMAATAARLDVGNRTDNTLTLSGSQTLKGVGQVLGSLTNASGTTVQPGVGLGLPVDTNAPANGTLIVSNNVALNGNVLMYIDKVLGVNARISGAQNIYYSPNGSGALKVTNLTDSVNALANGDSFQLFSATNIIGTFSALHLQPLNSAFHWDTSQLSSGILSVVANATNRPKLTSSALLNGTNLVLTGSSTNAGGQSPLAFGQFYVLATNTLAIGSTVTSVPVATWPRIATNHFDANGLFNVTNVVPSGTRLFIAIQVP